MMNNIDYESLRRDLIDYFGTATNLYPLAILEVIKIETATNNELINIATNNGFNIEDYKIIQKNIKLNRDL